MHGGCDWMKGRDGVGGKLERMTNAQSTQSNVQLFAAALTGCEKMKQNKIFIVGSTRP